MTMAHSLSNAAAFSHGHSHDDDDGHSQKVGPGLHPELVRQQVE
jgi:hypothetical protein